MEGLQEPGWPLAILLAVMVAATATVYGVGRLGSVTTAPRAAVRAVIQLAAVSTVLTVALSHVWSSLLVLAVMFVAAVITSAQRSQAGWSAVWLALAIATGLAAVLPAALISGVVPLQGLAIVPVGGIVLGGAMTATSLAARLALDTVETRWGEVEAALALGFSDRAARLEVIRPVATDALLPGLDQTRTVGLVTLPGAFVGVLLATGSAVQAGAAQILVLVGLMLAQTCAVAQTVQLVAMGRVRRAAPSAGRS